MVKGAGIIPATTSPAFVHKKQTILEQLSVPAEFYDDLSPKGTVDAEIRDFVNEINKHEGLVTTSSCSGRISVFLEGRKGASTNLPDSGGESEPQVDDNGSIAYKQAFASTGGKGGGGRWLFVSHEPIFERVSDIKDMKYGTPGTYSELFHLQPSSSQEPPVLDPKTHRFVHFKFEPMILHVLAGNPQIAQKVLSAALQSGFRESGASSMHTFSASSAGSVPIAVRTTGLAFDNIIGFCCNSVIDSTGIDNRFQALVPEAFLHNLVLIANEKFHVNKLRTERFRSLLATAFSPLTTQVSGWEAADVRKARMRAEGMQKKWQSSKQRLTTDDMDETIDLIP